MAGKKLVMMFDLDGTLLDTNELIMQSFRHTFARYMPEKELTQEELISFLGPPLKESLGRYFPEQIVPEAIGYYRAHNQTNYEAFVDVFPTVRETLNSLKNQNYPLAVITTKTNQAARVGLDMFELTPYFELIVGVDNVENTKPEPDGIKKCLKHFERTQGIMVGDSTADILAGKNAGVYTAGVEWTFKPVEVLTRLEPDYMLRRMEDVVGYAEQLEKQI